MPQSHCSALWQTASDVIFSSIRYHLDEWRLNYCKRKIGREERIIEQTRNRETA